MNRITGKRFFIYETPKFGTKLNRKPASGWTGSPYYWWWEYLRRNAEYRQCCLNNGKGKLANLYKIWGDIYKLSFREWWSSNQQGAWLFSEKVPPTNIEVLISGEQFEQYRGMASVLMVALPLRETKAQLRASLTKLLAQYHKGKQGNSLKKSSARFSFCAIPDTATLEITLAVYDEWMRVKNAGLSKTKAQLGIDMRLVREYMPLSSDRPAEITAKKNKMSATVSRYISNAEALIRNVANGRFPDQSRPAGTKRKSHVTVPRIDILRYWKKRKSEDLSITMADIGFELNLNKSWMPKKGDDPATIKVKRNKMNATVSRFIKNAESYLATTKGSKQA